MEINYLAVLVAAIASMIIGGLWYSPVLFGNVWMKLSGITQKDVEKAKKQGMMKSMGRSYFFMFVMCLLTAYILAVLLNLVQAVNVKTGIHLGLLIWLGFIATVTSSSVIWEKKPFKLYIIGNGYNVVNLVVMSIILTLWH
ncbi:DUF1761 domain-containing protein [Candidatus Woesearchaeota archaeon]|nr:MAG: hypothetical protein QT09_C0004G0092 [archaeon GW2011_AR18]MBS3162048.1 DUF1761 domain-containing protein [Candidatus Woesearchaeota archaeon]HIH25913.1 DUF1761 domain-containing protein [Nanoarchaeota archaeon]